MKEKDAKKEWKDPEITVLSVNDDTKLSPGDIYQDDTYESS